MDVLKLIREAIEDNLTGKVFVWNDEVMDYFDNDQAALVRFLLKKNFDKIILEARYYHFTINNPKITELPNNMETDGGLELKLPFLKKLPNNLTVAKTLDCEETLVGKLPADAKVGTFIPSIILVAKKRRRDDVWSLDKLTPGGVGEKAHALYQFLLKEEIVDEDSDIYNLIPYGNEGMIRFQILNSDKVYSVGTDDETEAAARESIEDSFDDMGVTKSVRSWVWEGNVNEIAIKDYLSFIEDDIRDEPDNYGLTPKLSDAQEAELTSLREKLETLEDIEDKTDEIDDQITEIEDRIQEIEDNPEGELDEDEVNSIFNDRISEFTDNITYFFEHYGISDREKNKFIDIDGVVDDVIKSDGYTTLSGYDGKVNEEYFNNTLYYVIRLE